MSGDGTDNVSIPLVFLFLGDAQALLHTLETNPLVDVTLGDYPKSKYTLTLTSYISHLCIMTILSKLRFFNA